MNPHRGKNFSGKLKFLPLQNWDNMGLYAGDISALAAWELLAQDKNANLVDVRTPEEWQAGTPDLARLGKQALFLSWKTNPGYVLNDNFIKQLEEKKLNKDAPIFFLCKGGGRSRESAIAATAAGYKNAYNIISGFEAEGGWKFSQLPQAGAK